MGFPSYWPGAEFQSHVRTVPRDMTPPRGIERPAERPYDWADEDDLPPPAA